jgi:hypothetical protein
VGDEGVKEGLVAVLQIAHQRVLGKGGRLIVQGLLAAFALVLESADVGRQQAVKRKGVSFLFSERGALVELWVEQKVIA